MVPDAQTRNTTMYNTIERMTNVEYIPKYLRDRSMESCKVLILLTRVLRLQTRGVSGTDWTKSQGTKIEKRWLLR